ncbi:MAG TPA: hypothetical protein VHA52_05685 [Candidatus Babeliaceae bacterium]|nr:hypothetical protein [Candidatus Babeliaceae bacterium]
MYLSLLKDKSRLQEIYDLRVIAWERSSRKGVITKDKWPNGWHEEIDHEAFNFIIENDSGRIIASARISIHEQLDELPYPSAFQNFSLPEARPFAFYSRLVVHPDFRSHLLYKELDGARIALLEEKRIPFAIVTCPHKRLKSLMEAGFEILGKTWVDFYGTVICEYALLYKTTTI